MKNIFPISFGWCMLLSCCQITSTPNTFGFDMDPDQTTQLLGALAIGCALGVIGERLFYKVSLGGYKKIASEIVHKGELEADAIRRNAEQAAKQASLEHQREIDKSWQAERRKILREEERLKEREDKLETRMTLIEKKLSDIERRETLLAGKSAKLDDDRRTAAELKERLQAELEKSSGLSANEAKEQLLSKISDEVKSDAANLIRRTKKEAEENAEREACKIITTAINRLAVPCVSEGAVNTVPLPNEEMKGRIIGREGRNIRALERAAGVNFIIDDTPGVVVLSGFDPVRLHVAKLSLTELLADGRIHPTRIEEVVEKNKVNVQKQIKMHGEDAALRAGAMNLHPEIITLLGKLKFRFSYGQNVLDHSVEVSHLMGIMAAELGLDVRRAKRIGLLHDMGKAATHEIEGSHAVIGHDLAIKYGEAREVANGIGCHHHEMEPMTIEGSLCSSADALSASRPGARIEAVEEYVKRLKKLEDLALEYHGVEKAYALQAGREIRIVVLPDVLDDDGVVNLARSLTKRIETELSYPGKIKVTVIREKRVVEYAV